jgi:hypothetical protein
VLFNDISDYRHYSKRESQRPNTIANTDTHSHNNSYHPYAHYHADIDAHAPAESKGIAYAGTMQRL